MASKPVLIKRQQSVTQKCSGKYWEKLKNVEVKKISQYKTKETNIKMRHYWNDVIREMERLAMQQAEQTKIKINDLSTSLPPKLYKRISKIIKLNPIEEDLFEDEFEDKNKSKYVQQLMSIEDMSLMNLKKPIEVFNESTCTIINKLENEYSEPTLQLTEKPIKKLKKSQKNWQAEYLLQKQKERIKWNSKLYQLNTDIWEKPLYEQAETLMDNSADAFLEWLNNLSKLSKTSFTKDILKSLFSLETDKSLSGGIQIEPKIMGAVPAPVAVTWNMPDKSIALKLQQNLESMSKIKPKNIKTHAFGRTLPHNMRPWIPPDSFHIIKPDIPEDIRHRKILFQGITHLRATKNFIDLCRSDPNIEKPEYLRKLGCFNDNEKELAISRNSIAPLTELLDLKFL